MIFFGFGSLGISQISRSAFFLEEIPAANMLNPAFHPDCNYYISIPLVSSFYLGFESPFTFDELTEKWESGDSLYIDRESVMGALENKNYFSFELYNELGRGGVRFGRHFIHLSIAKVFSTKFAFEKEFAALMLYGNGHDQYIGKLLNFNNSALNMNSYHEFALGYSIRIGDKITLGTRLKYLNGAFNIWTEKTNITLFTDDQPNFAITASSDIMIHTSSTISSFNNLIKQVSNYKWFDLTGNHGYGFDLGLDYEPSKKVKLSASITDIGWIRWKENVKNFKSVNPGVEYTFDGFEISDFIRNGSFRDTLNILDTIVDHFGLETTHEPYTSHLNPKIYVGTLWRMTRRDDAGFLLRTDIAEDHLQLSFTLNYSHHFGKVLTVNANYSWINQNFYNIGLGLVAKLGPVQLYALNDMIIGLIDAQKARNYNFQFGIGFLFGSPKNTAEMPTYYPSSQPSQ
jgi:hypothetical protein